VCQSSEMYELSNEEKLALASRVVKTVAGRVPVIACGNFGRTPAEQATFIRQIYKTGVSAVVLVVSLLAKTGDSDDIWKTNCQAVLDATGDIPLGLYECPKPYHRLLTPDVLGWAISTGRFLFLKDTSCAQKAIQEKLAKIASISASAASGGPENPAAAAADKFRLFNANIATLSYSLQAGAAGFCGIAANFYPDLMVWLNSNYTKHHQQAALIQRFLTLAEATVEKYYPQNAKLYLKLFEKGFRFIQLVTRVGDSSQSFKEEDMLRLSSLYELVSFTREELKKDRVSTAKPVLM